MWSALPAPDAGLRCVVVLPVRNEAAHVVGALAALAGQQRLDGGTLERAAFEILLLANNCDDASAALARCFVAAEPTLRLHVVETTLPTQHAHIGHVRRCLMDEACRRLERVGQSNGIIASTDSDTCVAAHWLAHIERELAGGADAVGGRILTDDAVPPTRAALRIRRLDAAHSLLRSRLASLLDPDPIDPWPRHHQHFGASLALTARAYRLAGGVPEVRYLEDVALVRALRRADLRVRHSPAVRVRTSGRLDGRAEVGLSWQLRQWAEGDGERHDPLVEAPASFAQTLRMRASLRRAWSIGRRSGDDDLQAESTRAETLWSLPSGSVADIIFRASFFGAAWQDIESLRDAVGLAQADRMPMSQATAHLRAWVGRAQAGVTAP